MMRRVLIAAAAGMLGALVVVIQALVLWPRVYVHVPWRGYEYASAHGLVDRCFTESPAALVVSLLILFVVALVTLKKSPSFSLLSALTFYAAIPALPGWLAAIAFSHSSSVPAAAMR